MSKAEDKKNNKIIVACILSIAICICAFMFIYYGNKNKDFEYNKHLEENILTISSKDDNVSSIEVNLQEMAYYIINVEGDIQDMACQFDSEHPNRYWLIKIEPSYDMKDYAKDLAYDTCVRNYVYYMEAVKSGRELSQEELKLASDDAKTIMKNLSGKQMDMSDYSEDVLYNLQKKLYLATKHVNALLKEGYTIEELELEGSYYEDLLKSYDINVNDDLWDGVVLGNLSVDNS